MDKQQSIELFRAQARPPQEAIRPIEAGRLKRFSDINPQWRVEALTETYGLYGVGWFVQVKDTQYVDLPETQEKMIFLTRLCRVQAAKYKQEVLRWEIPPVLLLRVLKAMPKQCRENLNFLLSKCFVCLI